MGTSCYLNKWILTKDKVLNLMEDTPMNQKGTMFSRTLRSTGNENRDNMVLEKDEMASCCGKAKLVLSRRL